MTYNKIRHLELLRRFLDFEKQGKGLYTENRDEYIELQEYRSALYHHIFWKSKEQFVLLMDNFIHDSIDMEQFEIAFSRLWWETIKAYDAFEIDLKRVKNFQLVRQAPPPPHRQLFGGTSSSPRNNYFSKSSQTGASLCLERPSAMPHQEYTSLTKEQQRNLPDPRDRFIIEEGHPHLVARYSQVHFKTPDHGRVHGLPTNEKGLTPKTEKNALAIRNSIINMPNRKGIVWFDNGMYQGGTERGYDSINIFDKKTDTIAVFKKDENGEYSRFTTTCTLTEMERDYLFESGGNFVTENNLKNPEVLPILKNLMNTENEK